jgi:hypothetical protein
MTKDDERDLARILEEHARRLFNAPNEQERKKAEREIAEHIARPELTDDINQLAREFEIRLKRAATLPPDTPAEYREAFTPLLERVAAIPPLDRWETPVWDLSTQHMVRFFFAYDVEPLCALLGLKAFGLIEPSHEYFKAATADPDDIERARKTREFVEHVETDVVKIAQRAFGHFIEALRGRLGSVLDETLYEIAVRAISELEAELNTTGEKHVVRVREHVLKERTKVEKVRLGTPGVGPRALTKEVFEAMIDQAQAALRPHKMDQTKNSVLTYINNNYPAVRCGSVYHLNRLLKKFGLEGKFRPEQTEQNSE